MYWGALFGGSTTSILFNIPGEPSSVATTFDGYPLATAGPRDRGAGDRVHGSRLRRAGRRRGRDAHRQLDRRHRAALFAAGVLRGLPPRVLQLHRHGRRRSAQDGRLAADRPGAGGGRHGHGVRRSAADIRQRTSSCAAFRSSSRSSGCSASARFWSRSSRGCSSRACTRGRSRATSGRACGRCRATAWRALRSTVIGCWMGITPGGPTAASFMSYGIARRFSKRRRTSAKARSKASCRRRRPITRPASRRCCRCSRSACRARRPRP